MTFPTSRLRGYVDRPNYHAGESFGIKVSTDAASVEAVLVRIVNANPSPQGEGFIEEEIAELGSFAGRRQRTQVGSFVRIDHAETLAPSEGLCIDIAFQPTLPNGAHQVLISKSGWSLGIVDGFLTLSVGGTELRLQKRLFSHVWYRASAKIDVAKGEMTLRQIACVNGFNSRFGPVVPLDSDDEGAAAMNGFAPGTGPLVIAGEAADAGWVEHCFNGKIEMPCLSRLDGTPIAEWDFSAEITHDGIRGMSVTDRIGQHDGALLNHPTRGCTGINWQGKDDSYRLAPEQYGAIWFHADFFDDCRWQDDLTLTLPQDLRSGTYAIRLRGGGMEEYITFFVVPRQGQAKVKVAVIMPTFTYMSYGNFYPLQTWPEGATGFDAQEANYAGYNVATSRDLEVMSGIDPYGIANYDRHIDGAGVIYASWRKPMLMLRPKHLTSWNFQGDQVLLNWLEHECIDYEVITDHDIHEHGVECLKQFRTVLTVTHPEYCTTPYNDAWEDYLARGGRGLYLGGNGMYWVTALDPDKPWLLEVRRGETGDGAWQSEPGEQYMTSTGEHGGLWTFRGRSGYKIWGTSYGAHALEQGSYYAQLPEARDRRAAWIFDGIPDHERIGDFGAAYHGAAAVELDHYDLKRGTPPHAMLLASSIGHSPGASLVPELIASSGSHPFITGVEHPLVRADMVYFTTPNGGAMFSPSSIGWIHSLDWNGFDNNVARITGNVVRRFMSNEALEPTI